MFALDERTANVLTTIALFAVAAAIAYAARQTLVVFALALMLAYLLEPIVAAVQQRLPLDPARRRTAAIGVVYAVGAAAASGAWYLLAPRVADQVQRLRAAAPRMLASLSDPAALAQGGGAVSDAVVRAAATASAAVTNTGLFLMIPVVAAFFLQSRSTVIDQAIDLFSERRDRASVKRTVERIDTMLAEYVRAQLTLAGLSAAFYTTSMAFLHLPYPLVFGLVGGALEFLPVVGWVLASAMMLTVGWMAHANWLALGGALVAWRIVLDVAISPRVMGSRLQIEPITVLFALMAGGQIGGILGVVLAVPAAAIVRILWIERMLKQTQAAA